MERIACSCAGCDRWHNRWRMTAVGLLAEPGCCLPLFGSQARQSRLRPLALRDALQTLLQHANALGIVINRFNQPEPGCFVAWIGFYQRKQDLTGLFFLALMDVRDGLSDFFRWIIHSHYLNRPMRFAFGWAMISQPALRLYTPVNVFPA